MVFYIYIYVHTHTHTYKHIYANCQHPLDHRKSKRVPEKHLLLLYRLCQTFGYVDHHKLWKMLKEMGIPNHLKCLLRNQYAGQEATVRTGHGTTDWFQIGNRVHLGCILSPVYLTYMQSTSWEMPGWMEHKLESRLPIKISITSDMLMTPPLWQKACGAKLLQSCPTLCDSTDGSPSEHWSGLPFPSPIHESEKSKWSRSVVPDS